MGKKILITVIAIVALLAVVGLLLPRHAHVQRSVTINRPASLVYATVNSFVLFPKWSPWQDLDPNMTQLTEGPRDGVGAKLVWKGNDKVGSGTQVITASIPNQSIASDLDFGSMGTAKSVVTLTPEGSATRATWAVDLDMGANPIGHYIGLTMDGMLGKDFANGLGKLKSLVESMPNADIAGFKAEPVNLMPTPILIVKQSVPPAGIGMAYGEAFGRIGKFMAKNKLHQTGAPLGIEGEMTGGNSNFDAGIPVDRNDVAGADGILAAQSYAGKALKTIHVGTYDDLPQTQAKLRAYLAAHGYVQKGPVFSFFIDDPSATPVEKVRTEIYAPVDGS
ncbi:MAG: SRPBCC family protein [Pseudomonadota bacterium]|nr:SRPBCC family protein [Pseudomonadota bacterium]